jgi:hypothetical protein
MADVVQTVIANAPIGTAGVVVALDYKSVARQTHIYRDHEDADAQHQVPIVAVAVMYVSHG